MSANNEELLKNIHASDIRDISQVVDLDSGNSEGLEAEGAYAVYIYCILLCDGIH